MSGTYSAEIIPTVDETRSSRWAWNLVLFLATVIPFLPILRNGFVNWDDDSNFLQNPDFQGLGWANLKWAWTTFLLDVYQPLAWMILEAEFCLWGIDARGYHLASILLHGAVTLMLFGLATELLKRVGGHANARALQLATLTAVLLWAVHPLRVEAVAWVSCQPYLPCAFFYILALRAYLYAHPVQGTIQWNWLGFAWMCALAALLCKAVALSLPLVLVVLDFYPLRRFQNLSGRWTWLSPAARTIWLEKVPFLLLTVLFTLIAVWGRGLAREVVPDDVGHFTSRLIKITYGVSFYLCKTVNPLPQSATYPAPAELTLTLHPYSTATILVSLATVAVLALSRRLAGLTAVWFAYLAMLLPLLGLASNDNRLVAERYSYVPTLPWFILLAFILSRPAVWKLRKLLLSVALVACVGFSIQTWNQCGVWGSSERLFRQALANAGPDDPLLLNNLGAELLDQGKVDAAEEQFRRAIELGDDKFGAQFNMGLIQMRRGNAEAAVPFFEKAIEKQPKFVEAHKHLAKALEKLGRSNEAEAHLKTAVDIDADFTDARTELASLLVRQGRITEAIQEYDRALQSNPRQPDWHAAIGTLLARNGELVKAVNHLTKAVQLRPGFLDARANLGMALLNLGQRQEAEQEFQIVLRSRPDHRVARSGMNVVRTQNLNGR